MEILILSDSHGFFDSTIEKYALLADEIWHAGDIGDPECLANYERSGVLRAVSGNIDGREIRNICPVTQKFEISGLRVLMTHIAVQGKKLTPACAAEVDHFDPHLLVYGHTHIAKVWRPVEGKQMLAINPGAVGRHGFHLKRTMVKLRIDDGALKDLELIELGPRSEKQRGLTD